MQDNESTNPFSSGDEESFLFVPEMLDLLVDGELSNKERRQVLQHLDKTQNGWRDCAMAFLESAMIKESLVSDFEEESAPEFQEGLTDIPSSIGRKPFAKRAFSGIGFSELLKKNNLAMVAAGFLFAFLFYGILFYVIGLSPSEPSPHLSPTVLVNHEGTPSGRNSTEYHPMFSSMSPVSNGDLQYVTLDSCNPEWQGMQIPCYSGKTIDPKTYLSSSPNLDDKQIQQLVEAGHKVDVSRQNIVLQVNDGRRVVIPVDQVNVKYRPQPKFQ